MRLVTRMYLAFQEDYIKQEEFQLKDRLYNAADMYRRDVIPILAQAVSNMSEKTNEEETGLQSVCGRKSSLKVSILNLLKLTSNFLNGHFLIRNQDQRAKQVTDFQVVLKLCQDKIFSDAYHNLNYCWNVKLKKTISLNKSEDVDSLMEACKKMCSINEFEHPSNSFVTTTSLIIFNARRGGEPVKLQRYQWEEALRGEWVEKEDISTNFAMSTMYITYQTVKGADHLVPVLFLPETFNAMRYLTSPEVRRDAGVQGENIYVFASTQKSLGHADGWHCMNDILKRINWKGAINSTTNRHRVASILAKLELPEFDRQLIYKHFGHSEQINQTVYQALPGSLQLHNTGKHLMQINSLQGNAYPEKEKAAAKCWEEISRKSKRNVKCEGRIMGNFSRFIYNKKQISIFILVSDTLALRCRCP